MFDIGWSEIAIITVIAVVVIGPKDLPLVLRTVGKWVAKARGLAREFQSHVDDVIREAELDDIKKEVESIHSGSLKDKLEKTVDPDGTLKGSLDFKEEVDTWEEHLAELDGKGGGQTGTAAKPQPDSKPQSESKSASKPEVTTNEAATNKGAAS